MLARSSAAHTGEPFTGWTPEGLGSAIRTSSGEFARRDARRDRRIVAAALGLALALTAAALVGVAQVFNVSGKARRFRQH